MSALWYRAGADLVVVAHDVNGIAAPQEAITYGRSGGAGHRLGYCE